MTLGQAYMMGRAVEAQARAVATRERVMMAMLVSVWTMAGFATAMLVTM